MYDTLIQNLDYLKSVGSIKRRQDHIDRLKKNVETGNITVVTGVRRSGKSTLRKVCFIFLKSWTLMIK